MKKEIMTMSIINSTRSTVGRDMKLGTITMKSPKQYDRKKAKRDLKDMLKKGEQ